MVLQETWIREGTVRDNIAMGKTDATDEEKEASFELIKELYNVLPIITVRKSFNFNKKSKLFTSCSKRMMINC